MMKGEERGRSLEVVEGYGEDYVCYVCKDGGELALCDKRKCLKAYHPKCIGRSMHYFDSERKWHCPVHFCRRCERKPSIYCVMCPMSLCETCNKVRFEVHKAFTDEKGLCNTCFSVVKMIELNLKTNEDGTLVDFGDTETLEFCFKEYWNMMKAKYDYQFRLALEFAQQMPINQNISSPLPTLASFEDMNNSLTPKNAYVETISVTKSSRKGSQGVGGVSVFSGDAQKVDVAHEVQDCDPLRLGEMFGEGEDLSASDLQQSDAMEIALPHCGDLEKAVQRTARTCCNGNLKKIAEISRFVDPNDHTNPLRSAKPDNVVNFLSNSYMNLMRREENTKENVKNSNAGKLCTTKQDDADGTGKKRDSEILNENCVQIGTMGMITKSKCAAEIMIAESKLKTELWNDVMDVKEWYYKDLKNETYGPYSISQLRKWSKTGIFPKYMTIWKNASEGEFQILLRDALNLEVNALSSKCGQPYEKSMSLTVCGELNEPSETLISERNDDMEGREHKSCASVDGNSDTTLQSGNVSTFSSFLEQPSSTLHTTQEQNKRDEDNINNSPICMELEMENVNYIETNNQSGLTGSKCYGDCSKMGPLTRVEDCYQINEFDKQPCGESEARIPNLRREFNDYEDVECSFSLRRAKHYIQRCPDEVSKCNFSLIREKNHNKRKQLNNYPELSKESLSARREKPNFKTRQYNEDSTRTSSPRGDKRYSKSRKTKDLPRRDHHYKRKQYNEDSSRILSPRSDHDSKRKQFIISPERSKHNLTATRENQIYRRREDTHTYFDRRHYKYTKYFLNGEHDFERIQDWRKYDVYSSRNSPPPCRHKRDRHKETWHRKKPNKFGKDGMADRWSHCNAAEREIKHSQDAKDDGWGAPTNDLNGKSTQAAEDNGWGVSTDDINTKCLHDLNGKSTQSAEDSGWGVSIDDTKCLHDRNGKGTEAAIKECSVVPLQDSSTPHNAIASRHKCYHPGWSCNGKNGCDDDSWERYSLSFQNEVRSQCENVQNLVQSYQENYDVNTGFGAGINDVTDPVHFNEPAQQNQRGNSVIITESGDERQGPPKMSPLPLQHKFNNGVFMNSGLLYGSSEMRHWLPHTTQMEAFPGTLPRPFRTDGVCHIYPRPPPYNRNWFQTN